MRISSTLILAIAAAGAFVATTAIVRHDRAQAGLGIHRGGIRPLRAEGIPVELVDRIELTRDGRSHVYERGSGGGWMQLEPFPHPMDPFSMREIVRVLGAVQIQSEITLDDRVSAEALGLDPPSARLRVTWGTQSLAVELGRQGVAGRAYLREPGSSLAIVTDRALHERVVNMDEREWRDRAIFTSAGADSNAIVIRSAAGEVELQRERGQWFVTRPVRSRAGSVVAGEILPSLIQARGSGFILDQPDDLSRFGLEPPAGTIEIRTAPPGGADETSEILRIGARASAGSQDRFAMLEKRPTIIRVSEALLRLAFRPVTDFLSPFASGVAAPDIGAMRVRQGGSETRFIRDGDSWSAEGMDGASAAREATRILDLLTATAAAKVVVAEYPRDREAGLFVLEGFDGRPLDTVRMAQLESGEIALENGDGVLRVLSAGAAGRR